MDIKETLGAVETIPVSKARKDISKHISQVSKQGYRLALTNHNKAVAAIVPISDLVLLEKQDEAAYADAESWPSEFENETLAGTPRKVTLVEETAKDISSYLIGVISGRVSDAGIMGELNDFIILKGILRKTFQEAFDDKKGPNLPVERIAPAAASIPPATIVTAGPLPEFAIAAQTPEAPMGLGKWTMTSLAAGQSLGFADGISGQLKGAGLIETQETTLSPDRIQTKSSFKQANK